MIPIALVITPGHTEGVKGTHTVTIYRITFKGADGKENTLPVISTSAVQAVADLNTLGYKTTKVIHCFPPV